jgi:hypothetical protein
MNQAFFFFFHLVASGFLLTSDIRSIEIKFDRANVNSIDLFSIDRLLVRLIDYTGHSESVAAAETELETQTIFFFFLEHKTETKHQIYKTKI